MMQHNENSKPNRFLRFFRERGYYIVLALCVCAVGVSGYLFLSGAIAEKNALSEPAMSVATETQIPSASDTKPSTPAKPSAPAAEPEQTAPAPAVSADERTYAQAASVRVWPVSGAEQTGYSMESLAFNATTRDWRTHDGVDLTAAEGAPVRAAANGTVTAVYDDELLGTTVVIGHDDGYVTYYQNLAAMPTVSAGDEVEAGQTIGSVGNTAQLDVGQDAHLHFAVRQNGTSIAPDRFVD